MNLMAWCLSQLGLPPQSTVDWVACGRPSFSCLFTDLVSVHFCILITSPSDKDTSQIG